MKNLLILSALGALMSSASAQWSDNFDSYTTGQQLHGVGGWQGWDNVAGAGALTSAAQSFSAPRSVAIGAGTDLVHLYSGVNSGVWTYNAKLYMPSGRSGATYFILMNQYADTVGPYNWSCEIQMSAAGVCIDDIRTETPRTLNLNAWNDITVVFDMSSNAQRTYINGQLLSSGAWGVETGFIMNLAAVDLYAGGSANVFYDNLSLTPGLTDYAVTSGSEFSSHNVALARGSDDSRVRIFNDDTTLIGQVEFYGSTTFLTPSECTLTVEHSDARPGLAFVVDQYNYDAPGFDAEVGGEEFSTDSVTTVSLGAAAGAHVSATGAMTARVTWAPVNDEDPSQDGWLQDVDQVKWTVTP